MRDLLEQLHDEVRSAWRFRWHGMAVALAVGLLGWAVGLRMPPSYEASARVFVDTRSSLKPALENLALEQDVNAQINYVRQSLLSGTELEEVAQETGVLPETPITDQARMAILAGLSKRVEIQVDTAGQYTDQNVVGSLYTITYSDAKRDRAIGVADTLVKRFIENTLGGKLEESQNTREFLEQRMQDAEQRLRTSEAAVADFKRRNVGLMPTEGKGLFEQLQDELDGARKSESDLSIAMSRRSELSRQLRGESVISSTVAAPSSSSQGAATDTLSRLQEAQAKLDDLRLRFTERHPDVVEARSTVEELSQRRERELNALRRGDTSVVASSGMANNPLYQSVQLQLNQADLEIATLRGDLGQRRAKAAELRARLDSAPEAEAELAQLVRSYDSDKAQYSALAESVEKVRLGEQAGSAGSVRFEIVQEASAPYSASAKPLLFLVAVFGGALVAGGGLSYALHLLWPVVTSQRDVQRLTGLPVLGVVSAAFPAKLHAEARSVFTRFAMALVAFGALFGVVLAVHFSGVLWVGEMTA